MVDFNYMYIAVKCVQEYDSFILPLSEKFNINLNCTYDKTLSERNRKKVSIYKVTNYDEFKDHDLLELLKAVPVYNEELNIHEKVAAVK